MKYFILLLILVALTSCKTTRHEKQTVWNEEVKTMTTVRDVSWADHFEQLHLSSENRKSQKWDLKLISVDADGTVEIEDTNSNESITEYPKKVSRAGESRTENFTIYQLDSSHELQTASFRIAGTVTTITTTTKMRTSPTRQ